MNKENYMVLSKIIAAVETGGQVYGNGRYDDYTPPYKNTPNEYTITLGTFQAYGYEAKKLIQMIFDKDKSAFRKVDTCSPSIESMLSKDWVAMRWNPNSGQKSVLIKLISSNIGRECQDELFAELMKKFVADCEATYTKDVKAVMMYCQIRHLAGKSGADRIFKRCKGNYSMDNIMWSLKQDQYDTSSSNQAGDQKFWSRHEKCYEFINKYAVSESGTDKKGVTPTASALSRAKTLLRQPQGDVMTGYTPDGKSYFVSAGAWTKTPKKGYVIYFYSSAKGRVGHVGIVEKVDEKNKIVHTIEGNTSSTEYAENGGCVARHSYSYASQGGTNRVNGFGIPNFEGAGVTADQFVTTAVGELGYLEKRSNRDLDSKTANSGSNNYQKYQRDVGAGNGDQWCQYFTDACALYTCQGNVQPTVDYITIGATGEKVKELQTMLTVCGYACGGVDGVFGQKTSAALKAFKKANGMLENDHYGAKTEEKLKKVYAEAQKNFATRFLSILDRVINITAKEEHWVYDDSHALPPCADHKCSCDRSPSRALYDMGYTDQREGGETCGTLPDWLPAHGWTKITDRKKIQSGAIVAVRKKEHNYIDHVFVVKKYYPDTDRCDKYDTGSTERIQAKQPYMNVPLVEWSDRVFVCAWNPPSSGGDTPSTSDRVWNGVDYKSVYAYNYYKKKYADLRKAYGNNKAAYFDHFCQHGMKEGRQGRSSFDVKKYKERYADLRKAYGDNLPKYYEHYCVYGKKEGRKGN